MNEIVAVDPEAPASNSELVALFSQFGMHKGKFIAQYPRDWEARLLAGFLALPELDRARCVRLLDRHRTTFLPTEARYLKTHDWPSNVDRQRYVDLFVDKVVTAAPNDFGFSTLVDYLWDDDGGGSGQHISMSLNAYRKAVRPLFVHSTEVHLIDRYFQLRGSGKKIHSKFELLTGFLMDADELGRCKRFLIHFSLDADSEISEESQEKQLLEDLGSLVSSLRLNNVRVEFTLDDDLPHGRYIFSAKGGLHFDHGFVISRGKSNHVHWMSDKELEPLVEKFGDVGTC